VAVEDSGFLGMTELVGSAFFDLASVYDHRDHEIYGKWVALMNGDRGSAVQGFLRLSMAVLREGDIPKIHSSSELDEGAEVDNSLVMQMPDIEVEPYILTVRINRVEIGEFGVDRPAMKCRLKFGRTEVMTSVGRTNYNHSFNEELLMPIYLPTLTDKIKIDILDTRGLGVKVICGTLLSFNQIKSDQIETQWINMYGSRPMPPGAVNIYRGEDESSEESSYRGRILMYATAERAKPDEPLRVMMIPRIYSKADNETLMPREGGFMLRCDLYDACGIPATEALDNVYVIVTLGPYEKKSTACSLEEGLVRFESNEPGKDGYYEQIEDLKAKMPEGTNREQHYDIFVHLYLSTPLGDRRVGYKRYKTNKLLQMIEDRATPVHKLTTPKWELMLPDPLIKDELQIASAMLQFSLIFGPEKQVLALPRKRKRIPKLKAYELRCNIYQATGLQPADDNGLADPYVRIQLAGAKMETPVIKASLNPIWNKQLTFPVMMASDLEQASKISLTVYDSDPAFLNQDWLKPATKEMTDGIIARVMCPPGGPDKNVSEFYNKVPKEPTLYDLYDPIFADLASEDEDVLAKYQAGSILCSFELRIAGTFKDAIPPAYSGPASAGDEETADGAPGSSTALTIPQEIAGHRSIRPPTKTYLIELSVVGCRDVPARDLFGVQVPLTKPYIEFEYGDDLDPNREREWRIPAKGKTVSDKVVSTGSDINLLEMTYIQVELPIEAKTFHPWMGVRVREEAKAIPFLPFGEDPIMGITMIDLLEEMPSFQEELKREMAEKQEAAERDAEERERQLAAEADNAASADKTLELDQGSPNEVMLEEIVLASSSTKVSARGQLQMKKEGGTLETLGERTNPEPEAVEPTAGDGEDDEEEGEEEELDLEEPLVKEALENTLKDGPFKLYHLSSKPPDPKSEGNNWWEPATKMAGSVAENLPFRPVAQPQKTGLLKMKVRVIDYEGHEEYLRENPPRPLKKLYAERPVKIRVHIYCAQGLSPRPNGQPPTPFLKIYNVEGRERTTIDIPTAASLDPDFYYSCELAAVLPGQARLHLEVWDFQLFTQVLIGKTIVDLEDRLFSREWQAKQDRKELPKEMRTLTNPASQNSCGFLTCKVEIYDKKQAIANPLEPIVPPSYDMFELRIIVWEAIEVKPRDEGFFGGGGTSDVFISIQPHGAQSYAQYKTDTHWRSSGDAEFNYRMVWPMALPEKSPRLFLQIWDADILTADDAIGEAQLTLKGNCEKAVRRGGAVKLDPVWVSCYHPNYDGVQGKVRLTIELIPSGDAIVRPVGQGRGPPNQYPFLPEPFRPSLFDSLGINFDFLNPMYFFKKYFWCCCACLIVVAVVFVVIIVIQVG